MLEFKAFCRNCLGFDPEAEPFTRLVISLDVDDVARYAIVRPVPVADVVIVDSIFGDDAWGPDFA
jgi:hypothetical protein